MIANLAICLLMLGILSLWKFGQRYDRFVVIGSFLAVSGLLFAFLRNWEAGEESFFFLLWDSSASGDIRIAINSAFQNYAVVFSFFMIAYILLFPNLFFRQEKMKKNLPAGVFIIWVLCFCAGQILEKNPGLPAGVTYRCVFGDYPWFDYVVNLPEANGGYV